MNGLSAPRTAVARGDLLFADTEGGIAVISMWFDAACWAGRACWGASFAAGAEDRPAPRPDEPREERRHLKVIVTGGHPGDPEYGCGGTIARYTDLGHDVALLYLNRGEWPPSRTTRPAPRMAEAARACEVLKARPLYAGQANSKAVVNAEHYAAFRKILEAERPDAVFTHWPIDNHADHRAISMLVYDAWLRMRKRSPSSTTRSPTARTRSSSRPPTTSTSPRPRRENARPATPTPARRPNKYYALQEQVTRMRGIESGHGRPKPTSGTSRAPICAPAGVVTGSPSRGGNSISSPINRLRLRIP